MTTIEKFNSLLNQSTGLDFDLELYSKMTDEEVCTIYNVDYREEALDYIRDWWA